MKNIELEKNGNNWSLFYNIAGVCAIFSVLIIPVQIVLFILSPPPETAIEFISLFQKNIYLGLASMDFLYLINNALGLVLFPALYLTLRKTNKSLATLALIIGVFGSASFFVSNTSINFLYLTKQYTAAVTDAQKSIYIAAGESMMSLYQGTAYHMHYILGCLSLLIFSFLMVKSGLYKRSMGVIGIVTNLIAFGLYVPEIGVYISTFSVIGYAIWFTLIAKQFFILARKERA